ncbi:hypothetical protein [uncultured Brevundimonas sp.]|uniref:hypothetical protein n=1 Tax=uncultured Brevundimonas sp. TaxID=213418 RepID=UPI0025F5D2CF|nr:hypothetical protein [uncultured Brevundimonas sp.]
MTQSNAELLSPEETRGLIKDVLRGLIGSANAARAAPASTWQEQRRILNRIEGDMERLVPGSVAWARQSGFMR